MSNVKSKFYGKGIFRFLFCKLLNIKYILVPAKLQSTEIKTAERGIKEVKSRQFKN